MKKLTLTFLAAATMCAAATAQPKVKYLSTYTDKLQVEQLQVPGQTARISRTLYAGYNSICLPMSLTAEQLQTAAPGVRVERFAAIHQDGATLCLYFVDCTEAGIEAGSPYLIFSPKTQSLTASTANAKAIGLELNSVRLSDQRGNTVVFGSSWQTLNGSNNRYGIPAKQDVEVLESVLIPTDPDKKFLPTRCGFTWDAQASTANAIQICHINSLSQLPTGITSVSTDKEGKAIYDLSGRRATTAKKGIYVVDGKKTAVK